MIIFIGSRRQTFYLRHMRYEPRFPPWHAMTYNDLYTLRQIPAGVYVFVGVDRLDNAERRMAGKFFRHINSLGPGWQALNDPALGMGRFRLLRTLHEKGINDFNAYLVSERIRPERFPVFIRRNVQSTAPLTGLIHEPAELDRQIRRLVGEGEPEDDLLIIEYCSEPLRPGVFRKFGAYRLGQKLVPSFTMFSTRWIVKYRPPLEVEHEDHVADQRQMLDMPWRETLQRAFDLAHIDYGRADFGLVNGRPQIYEINYNPDIRTRRRVAKHSDAVRQGNLDRTETMFFAAMRELNVDSSGFAPTLKGAELLLQRLRPWRNYAPQRY
jgi:hypothetical protein